MKENLIKTRAITPTEKRKIEEMYETSIIFKLEEILVSTTLAFIFISFGYFLIHKIISLPKLNDYWNFLLISIPIGCLSIRSKYKNRKKLLTKIFSKRKPVIIYYFNVSRYINLYPQSKHQSEYLCEIEDGKTLFFRIDKSFTEKISKGLKIEIIEVEIPTILAVTRTGFETAIEIFPKALNIGILEEEIEHEFYMHQRPISDFYQ